MTGGLKADPPVDVVLDTDTFNEIDDQFAWLPDQVAGKLRLQAVYAAPSSQQSRGPGDGMVKSYGEILNVLPLMGRKN